MSDHVSLYEAKTHLSSLVDRAAGGEDIVITKHGQPRARLVGLPRMDSPRVPTDAMRITYIADDFESPAPEIEALFYGSEIGDD